MTVAALRTNSIIYLARHDDQLAAREAILTAMVRDLLREPTARLVLESRAGQDQRDRSVISRAIGSSSRTHLAYGHEVGYHEPLLWVPDAIAWAWGRGGRWRQMVSDLGLIDEIKRIEAPLDARRSGRSPSGEEPDLLPRPTGLGNCIITLTES